MSIPENTKKDPCIKAEAQLKLTYAWLGRRVSVVNCPTNWPSLKRLENALKRNLGILNEKARFSHVLSTLEGSGFANIFSKYVHHYKLTRKQLCTVAEKLKLDYPTLLLRSFWPSQKQIDAAKEQEKYFPLSEVSNRDGTINSRKFRGRLGIATTHPLSQLIFFAMASYVPAEFVAFSKRSSMPGGIQKASSFV